VPTFVVRNQGFHAERDGEVPIEGTEHLYDRNVYATRAAAEAACAAIARAWVRSAPIASYVEDPETYERVIAYMTAQWPERGLDEESDLYIPGAATDAQVDEIVKRLGEVFALVVEV
jgi:hypothetical protein